MSVEGENPRANADVGGTLGFDLACLFDDPDDPSEVTIFDPAEETTTTRWITADRETAVMVTEMR